MLTDCFGGTQDCTAVFGGWIFDWNVLFVITLACDDLDYCCTNYDKTKGIND